MARKPKKNASERKKEALIAAIQGEMQEREAELRQIIIDAGERYKCAFIPEVLVGPNKTEGRLTIVANPAEKVQGLDQEEREARYSETIDEAVKRLDCIIVPVVVVLPGQVTTVVRPVANKLEIGK
jgi:hypothetical protein